MRLKLPAGDGGSGTTEVVGRLIGRDHSRCVDLSVPVSERDPEKFRAVVQLDDGTIILTPLDSIIGREDD